MVYIVKALRYHGNYVVLQSKNEGFFFKKGVKYLRSNNLDLVSTKEFLVQIVLCIIAPGPLLLAYAKSSWR